MRRRFERYSKPINMIYDMVTGTLVCTGRRRDREGYWLIVVYRTEDDAYWIVTAIDTKGIDKGSAEEDEEW